MLIYDAAGQGDLEMVKKAIDNGADVNFTGTVRVVVSESPDCYTCIQLGTALHKAVLNKHQDIIELLMEQPKIKVDATDHVSKRLNHSMHVLYLCISLKLFKF